MAAWDLLIRQSRAANVLSSLRVLLDQHHLLQSVPPQAREHLEWIHISSQRHRLAVQFEVSHLRKALSSTNVPLILLKGAAYVMANLPASQGRLFSDIDLMVPKERLGEIEAVMMLHGWVTMHVDDYDQRYYRTWMHELPPMQHIHRRTVIDVHHAILPETASIHPSPTKLLQASQPLNGCDDVRVFSPEDMVLHSATHLFYGGEFDHGLRDLLDLHHLLIHFGEKTTFWTTLLARGKELDLHRPLFYALRYTTHILHTPIPTEVITASEEGRPNTLLLMLMDALFHRALMAMHESCSDLLTRLARHALYIRGNWLRMPPILLTRHLFHKAFFSHKDH